MSTVGSTSIKTPKIVRTGMPAVAAFTCPPYPKWVTDVNGKPYLVQTQAEELGMLAAKEKAAADAAEAKATADAAAAAAATKAPAKP